MRENNEYIDFNNIETALNNLSYNNWVTGTAVDFMAYSNIFLRILHLSWQNTAMSIVTQYHFSLSVDLSHFHPKVARHTRKAIWKRTPGNMRNRSHIGGVARNMCHVPCAICMWRHATSVRKVLCTSGCTFSKDVPRATCHLDVKATYEGYIPGGDAAAKRLSWASQNRKVSPSPSIKPRSPGTVTSREETIGVQRF